MPVSWPSFQVIWYAYRPIGFIATGAGAPAATSRAESTLNGSGGFARSSMQPAHGQFDRRVRQGAKVAAPSDQSIRSPSPSRFSERGRSSSDIGQGPPQAIIGGRTTGAATARER